MPRISQNDQTDGQGHDIGQRIYMRGQAAQANPYMINTDDERELGPFEGICDLVGAGVSSGLG